MEFDGKGEWCFGNDYGRDVIIFVVDNGWSSHADNLTHKLLVLGEKEKPLVLMKPLVRQKKIVINFTRRNTKYCLSLHYNADNG